MEIYIPIKKFLVFGNCRETPNILSCVIDEKGLPGLRRRLGILNSILRNGPLRDLEPENAKLRLDPRRSPK